MIIILERLLLDKHQWRLPHWPTKRVRNLGFITFSPSVLKKVKIEFYHLFSKDSSILHRCKKSAHALLGKAGFLQCIAQKKVDSRRKILPLILKLFSGNVELNFVLFNHVHQRIEGPNTYSDFANIGHTTVLLFCCYFIDFSFQESQKSRSVIRGLKAGNSVLIITPGLCAAPTVLAWYSTLLV